MAIKAVNATQLDADLTTVANAIRAKGGTSAPLSFPSGMASAIGAISTGITPTGTINITTNGTHDVTSKATANVQVPTGTERTSSDVTVSGRTVTVPAGLYGSQVQKSIANGTVTLNTPTVNASGLVTASATLGQAGYIGSAPSNKTLQLTTQGAQTITPGLSAQTIAANQYLTGAQTVAAITGSLLTSLDSDFKAENIKSGVNMFGVVGTHEGGGGGGSGTQVSSSTAALSSAASSIRFTGLLGEPTSFVVVSVANLATGASPYKTAAVVYDGTEVHGQYITNTNNAQMTYSAAAFSQSYSAGTLTVTGSGTNFQANEYKLIYSYGGSAADVRTVNVQVGSGVSSITFTGLAGEPSYFSCIFKSNIGTASGYTRAHVVAGDGTQVFGMEMGSQSQASDSHWTANYSGGSLTIRSDSTSRGGYFHQPGYYQLTYVIAGESGEITAEPLSVTANGTYTAPAGKAYSPVTVNVPTGTPRSSADLTVSGRTVTVPAGLYSDAASKSVPAGTQGTPTATKSISGTTATVTPNATDTTGYITGTTKTGTAVTVTAAELDTLGTKSINANGTGIDVIGYSAVDVAVPGSEITAEPLSVTENGTYTAPTGKAYSPVTINVPTGTPRSSSDLTVSGATVTVPAGLYSVQATKSVANGTAGTPTASKGSVSNHAVSVTPSVTNSTGYITGGTKSGSAVTVSASELVSGTRSITANGTGIDVGDYKYVNVAVSGREGYVGQETYEDSVGRFSVSFPVDTDNLIAFLMYNTESEFYNRLHGCIRAMFVDRNDSGKSILLFTRYANTSGDIDELEINAFQYVTVSYGINSISVSVSDEDWNLPRSADYTLIPIYSQ